MALILGHQVSQPIGVAPANILRIGASFQPQESTTGNPFGLPDPFVSKNQIAWSPDTIGAGFLEAPFAGYIDEIGITIRKNGASLGESSTMYWWVGIYSLNEAGVPETLLARSARGNCPSVWGGYMHGPVVWTNAAAQGGGVNYALRVQAGQRLALGVKIESQHGTSGLQHAELAMVAGYPATKLWWRWIPSPVLNVPPTSPFLPTSFDLGLRPAVWVKLKENNAPTVALTSPTNGQVLTTATPTLTGTFDDGDVMDPLWGAGSFLLDYMAAYEVEIADNATGQLLWGGPSAVFGSTAAERAANAFSRPYNGPPLVFGPTYRYRAQVYDSSGAGSGFSPARIFTIAARGAVDTQTDGVPNSKIDTDSSLITYTGRWSHPQSLAMTHASVRIYRNGALFRSGAFVAKAAAGTATLPGTAFSVGAVEGGIGALPPGNYTYRIVGRSGGINGLDSPESPDRAFTINAPPSIPANLQPPPGASSTSLPLLEWNFRDPDLSDIMGADVDAEIEFTRPNGTVFNVSTFNYDNVRGVGFYQVLFTDLGSLFGTTRWRVRGRDISATPGLGVGGWSAQQSFNYVNGPVVTITNPAPDGEVFDTGLPTFSWTNTGGSQVRARVNLYAEDQTLPLRTADISGGLQSFAVPVGWISPLSSNYDLTVTVWTPGEIQGTSLRRRFSVQYVPPRALNNVQVSGYPERYDHPASPSSILVTFDPTQYGPGEFSGYNIYRKYSYQDPSQATLLRTLTAPGQNRWRDAWPPSGIALDYGVSQLRRVGSNTLESPIVWVSIQILMEVPLLVSAYNPDLRFPVMYVENDYSGKVNRPNAKYYTWGSGNKKTKVTTPANAASRTTKVAAVVRNDARGTMYEHIAALETLIESGHPCLFRAQRTEERFYCDIEMEWKRNGVGERTYSLILEEIDFTPGQSGGS